VGVSEVSFSQILQMYVFMVKWFSSFMSSKETFILNFALGCSLQTNLSIEDTIVPFFLFSFKTFAFSCSELAFLK
jgi:hypothetical protein